MNVHIFKRCESCTVMLDEHESVRSGPGWPGPFGP